MYGFLDGPHGVFAGNFVVITDEIMDGFRNTGAAPDCSWNLLGICTLHIFTILYILKADNLYLNL